MLSRRRFMRKLPIDRPMRKAAMTMEKAYMLVPNMRWKYLAHTTSRTRAEKPEKKSAARIKTLTESSWTDLFGWAAFAGAGSWAFPFMTNISMPRRTYRAAEMKEDSLRPTIGTSMKPLMSAPNAAPK